MAGKIFGEDRLPLDPPYSYQLIATRKRHAIVRDGEASGNKDSEADNETIFSSFDIQALRRAAKSIEIEVLNVGKVTRLWPITVRLNARAQRGEMWSLEFPVSHISMRSGNAVAFQIESGPRTYPARLGRYCGGFDHWRVLSSLRLSQQDEAGRLAGMGATNSVGRGFVEFARIGGIEKEILSPRPEK